MKKKHTSTIWGIILIGIAVILVLSQLGLLGNIKIGLWTMLFTIFFVITLIQSIFHISFSGILFSIAFLCILYDDYLGITALTPWTVLVVALLGSIGLSMIFPPKKHSHLFSHISHVDINEDEMFSNVIDETNGDTIECKNSFGACIKYINSENFVKGYVDTSFGGTKLYFDHTFIQSEYAELKIHGSFCGIELFVPKTWIVTSQVDVMLAGITEKNPKMHVGGGSKLLLTGDLKFAGIEITYI